MIALQVVFENELTFEETKAKIDERAPRFREVEGLVQKLYLRDPGTGRVCGFYLFDSDAHLEAFLASDLRHTIVSAYEVKGDLEATRWDVFKTLYPQKVGAPPA